MPKVTRTQHDTWTAADAIGIGAGGGTPLYQATLIEDYELMQVLLDWNADVTVQDTNGVVVVQSAARDGHEHIQNLCQHHHDPMPEDKEGDRTALQQDSEIQAPYTGLVRPRDEGPRSQAEWRRMRREELGGLSRDMQKTEMLHAALVGNLDTLLVLMDITVDFDLSEGLHVNYHPRQTLLEAASRNGHNSVVEALLAAGAAVDASVSLPTPLFLASANGHEKVVRTLLAAGAHVEAQNRGTTPLQLASKRGDNVIVNILLDVGANVEGSRIGETPLISAAENGYNTIVERLLTAGADIEADRGRGTALVRASFEGWNEVVKTLLAAGANIQGTSGMTALQSASQQGHGDIVTTLVVAGADVEEAREGKTALRIALDRGHKDIAATLRLAGARSGTARAAYVARRQLGIKDKGNSQDSAAF